MASRWPRDDEAALLRFYGTPGVEVERQLVSVVPPFRMTYEGRPVRAIRFHAKAAPALRAALVKISDYYGRNQETIDRLGISKYAGAYNPRKIAGSDRWSNHAFAAAIDLNASENGFNTGHGTMPLPVVAAFKSEGFRWGGDYHGRTDPMHFEACNSGEPERTFEQWLAFYKCPPLAKVPLPRPAPGQPAPTPVPAAPEAPPRQPDDPGVEPEAVTPAPSLARRVGNWFAGLFTSGGIFYMDWRLGVLVVLTLVAGVAFLLWLFGREPIKAWISRHFGVAPTQTPGGA